MGCEELANLLREEEAEAEEGFEVSRVDLILKVFVEAEEEKEHEQE
jgi:hypothetical protein